MPICPIVDCHTHTSFSDGEATFEENVRAAVAAGCTVMVSTDHLTLPASMDPQVEVQVAEAELPVHRAAFDAARELAATLAPQMQVLYGFECDWYPGCEQLVERWTEGAAVRLGSVHWLGDAGNVAAGAAGRADTADVSQAGLPGTGAGWIDDGNDKHIWDELGVRGVWELYAETWCRACASPLNFDVMAHPDLAMRFVNEGYAPDFDLAPLWDQMAEAAHDLGRSVEVSTAGLRKTVGDYYPTRGLLERFARAEVPITFGSDAHRACDICWGIADAQRYAYDCGYRAFDMPTADGEWMRVEL